MRVFQGASDGNAKIRRNISQKSKNDGFSKIDEKINYLEFYQNLEVSVHVILSNTEKVV